MAMLVPQDPHPGAVSYLGGRSKAPDPAGRSPHRSRAWTVAGNLGVSFRYAAQGLSYAFSSQRNFRIHVGTGFVVIGLGL